MEAIPCKIINHGSSVRSHLPFPSSHGKLVGSSSLSFRPEDRPWKKLSNPKLQYLAPQRCPRSREIGALNLQTASSCMQAEYHDVEFQVRDYELDQYGVVNNAIFSHYIEHGLCDITEKHGVNVDEYTATGYQFAIREASLKFISPLQRRDRFVMKVKIAKLSATRMYFEYYILKLPTEEHVLEGRTTVAWLDKNFRPTRIPNQVRSKLQEAR